MKKFSYLFEYRRTPLRGYEQQLGRMEVEALAGSVRRNSGVLRADTEDALPEEKLRRVTFFEKVTIIQPDGRRSDLIPDQVILEKSTRAVRASTPAAMTQLLEHAEEIPNAGREHTYLSHAWHQYKGKFYPQLVRSAFVIAGLSENDAVFDPFVGSGTVLVETYLNNLRGFGTDLNPLSAYLSQAKTDCLSLSAEQVTVEIENLVDRLTSRLLDVGIIDELIPALEGGSRPRKPVDHSSIPSLEYLSRWFDKDALDKIAILSTEIREITDERLTKLLWVTLSNLLRDFSLQDPQQLRIQRRKDQARTERLLYRFVVDLRRNARAVAAMGALRERLHVKGMTQRAISGNATNLRAAPAPELRRDGQIDLIVTSPPYATALPYIDTDRLSLFLLGLLKPSQKTALDAGMIGNREIRDKDRRTLEQQLEEAILNQSLPGSVLKLIKQVRDLNNAADVGFRRRNLAALLYKYFADMGQSFAEMVRVLKPGGLCVVVIGNNYTVAGGKAVNIPTDHLLIDLAASHGMTLWRMLDMTDQPMYLPHSQNAIRSESIIFLRKPSA